MTALPLNRDHTQRSGAELERANDVQMADGTDLKKFHLSFTPVLKMALSIESEISGLTQTELIREAVLSLIVERITDRENADITLTSLANRPTNLSEHLKGNDHHGKNGF